jgi:hypothetical protein
MLPSVAETTSDGFIVAYFLKKEPPCSKNKFVSVEGQYCCNLKDIAR